MTTPARTLVQICSLAAALLVLGACTAARTGIQLQQAVEARDAAVRAEAPERAPFPYHMAAHYLDKAWEEAGHGQNKTSVLLAQKSIEWSKAAVDEIRRGSRGLDVDLADLDDTPRRPAPPTPRERPDLDDFLDEDPL